MNYSILQDLELKEPLGMTRQVTIRLSQKGPNKYFFRNKPNRWRAATRKVCVCLIFSHYGNIFKCFV